MLGPPRFYARRRSHYPTGPYRSVVNLKMITIQRIIWQRHDPNNRSFERTAAVRDLPPGLSPWTEQTKLEWRPRLDRARRTVPSYAIPTGLYALLLIPLVRRRQRWVALGVLALCFALHYASRNTWSIADLLFPSSYAYLDDYIYIDDVDLTPANDKPSTTIAAYDRWSFEGNRQRIIAFADGHVEELRDEEAKPLFEGQGLEYPARAEAGTNE